ncbi:GDP-mannose 4,6-dehydratase [Leifsonia sp. YIM 134122]|uniref:GDP-mannose 4,6-dehydratase n=1 Tax=Leifsonia stereocauli TaxID=3134136 RepID=A0ABU9W3H1_9MICO
MPTALITGITGQTGSYLGQQLVGDGWEVHGLVRSNDAQRTALAGLLPQATLHDGDLTDTDALRALVDLLEPDVIFNLGGLSSVAASWTHPVDTAEVTGLPVATLLDAAWRLRERTGRRVGFVQASSAEIFGAAETSPQNEQTPVRPTNPYGAAKAYGHHLVGVYRGLGLEASSCILFNHESPRRPETFVTRKITRGVARISLGLSDGITLGNLDAVRDWGHAPDYARAIGLAGTTTAGDYVVATGVPHSVRDFVAAAFDAVGIDDWSPLVQTDPAFVRPTDAIAQIGDARRAREVLGWIPTTGFAAIVAEMVASDLRDLSAG